MEIKLYTIRWKGGDLVPAHDSNPDGTQDPFLLLVGEENSAAAAAYQTEEYGGGDQIAVAITLGEAVAEGLLKPTR